MLDPNDSLLVDRLETLHGRPLSPEEKFEVELWDRGRTLSQAVNTEVYRIIMDTIKNFVDDTQADLMKLPPGHENVLTAHAAASAVGTLFYNLQEGIQNAINASMQTPPVLKTAARFASAVPPESL